MSAWQARYALAMALAGFAPLGQAQVQADGSAAVPDGAASRELQTVAVPSADTPPPVPASEEIATPGALSEVIVTARKREERLQDVPVSISAFSAEQLDARGINDVRD
ncbi:MAG: hypothetical protein ACREVL_12830, partial [Solimonas sp.]